MLRASSSSSMPVSSKKAVRRSPVKKVSAASLLPPMPHLCQTCHVMPAGSMEIFSLLLVLVFSLSAVLFTTVYALNIEKSEVASLRAELTTVQPE